MVASRRLVLMFPGQGAQRIGMGADLSGTFAVARHVFAEVDEALGESLSRSMFTGDDTILKRTENTQPALLAHSIAAFRVLGTEFGLEPRGVLLGHSVGEYAALVTTGSVSLADAARLLRARGLSMQKAADADFRKKKSPHAMLAVIIDGSSQLAAVEAAALAACARAEAASGLVASLAAVNTPTQFVLSGHAHALDAAVALLRKDRESSQAIINVRRVLPLNVSAPFHCSLMAPAAAALTTAVSEMASPLRDVQHAPLISGFGAAAVSTAADIQGALVSGIEAPVRWAQAVSAALSFVTDGVADGDAPPHFLELGPGSTLGAFVKALEPNACISSVGTVEQVRAFGSK